MDSIRINSQNAQAMINAGQGSNMEKQPRSEEKSNPAIKGSKPDMPGKKEIDDAVEKANRVLFKNNTHLKFKVHEKTKDVMVKVINDETGETVKEFPPEKILDMVAKLWEIAGLFVDEKR